MLICARISSRDLVLLGFDSCVLGYVTVDESVREEDGSDDEEKDEDKKDDICQLLKLKDGVSAQRQVLRALTLEV